LIICPSCGSTVDGDLCLGCAHCGARAIGPPLANAEHQLRSYGRATIVAASGAVLLAGFLSLVIATLFQFKGFPLRLSALANFVDLSGILAAGEVAAWRLKWVALPVAIAVLWSGARLVRGISKNPDLFIGLRAARAGFAASIVATLMVATLIAVTVPERVRRHQWGVEAGYYAQAYTIQRALLEYRALHGTLPPADDLVKGLSSLPDRDGSIAEALRFVDPNGYQATTGPFASRVKPLVLRGGALRNTATKVIGDPPGVSFTTYVLRLPSEHRLFGGDDDFVMRDGMIMKASEVPSSSVVTRPSVP